VDRKVDPRAARLPAGHQDAALLRHEQQFREVLEKHAPEQKDFPDAEIRAVATTCFRASDKYVGEIAGQHKADESKPQARHDDEERLQDLLARGKDKLSETEKTELAALRLRTSFVTRPS